MTGPRRRGVPDPADLDALGPAAPAPPGVRAAPDVDPVLGVTGAGSGGGSPQQRAAPPLTTDGAPAAGPGRVKEQFRGPADELALIRAAYWHTHVAEGHRNWSAFVVAVLRRERLRLEAEHNGGRPWAPVGKGELPTGRPLGA